MKKERPAQMDAGEDIYPGGFARLMKFLENRQRTFDKIAAVLPAPDCDLEAMKTAPTPKSPVNYEDTPRFSAIRKWIELQDAFEGQPQILHLHAFLVAVSRRSTPPAEAMALFFRIWREHGAWMADTMNTRWLISTSTTFADVGETGDQRALGMGLSTLFDTIKLHDSERRLTGQPAAVPFARDKSVKRAGLPFGMAPYSLKAGDLDAVLLARLWQLAERDPVIRPLGVKMLRMVMTDRRSIFGRAQKFKPAQTKPDTGWGL